MRLAALLVGMLAARTRALHLVHMSRRPGSRLLGPAASLRAGMPGASAGCASAAARREAPALSSSEGISGLRVLNTLTGQLEPFVPIDPDRVKWYTCGPTVYDAAHLGHARNYMGFDIVRRVLCDYFGLAVMFVMNITDIDDKIILRTHRNHLEAMAALEASFFEDMAALNVRPPDAVTRVTDYVPEIVSYIETIARNGYCYEANGSVYFDTAAFTSSEGKVYGKLVDASALADKELLAEGEGALSASSAEADKRHPSDFALWKASKPGEPAWPSPWGEGRPGWHIECSAMMSDLLGGEVDINAGGIDLKFPHHENQMAQVEAHYDCCKACNYFWHSGHLSIDGLKMSKSLKNFITIREALETYSARQLRFLFLLQKYHQPMEYSQNSMAAAADLERRFGAFEAALAARLREADTAADAAPQEVLHRWGDQERRLNDALVDKRAAVHAALLDCIDTPSAVKRLEQLIRAANSYMGEVPQPQRGATLLHAVARYYRRVMGAFGVETALDAAGAAGSADSATPLQLTEAVSSFRDTVRSIAIEAKRSGGEGAGLADEVLRVCDALRDESLPALGVRIEDRPSGVAQFAIDEPQRVLAEAARRREAAAQAEAAKAARAADQAAREAAEAARASVPPSEMFSPAHDGLFGRESSYGALDAEGIPLEDATGEPLSKSQRKKLVKLAQKQAKLVEAAGRR
ncbi:cysteine--tRNA ligase [Emiliania huxleyi CCMP1516]|uniref:cysteine--tRNA ligase n=2 Tax=Emiliania huxleyi TaxID=2903 RepID=A0A0D3I050_EMIH1|nr:cysteine--tRNA ligase [Emiliania huxleyi CCMP1516]EOD04635.1 cysteine--tRNA ligase [Emiliania huxleyi CCMP1516]|eukprot:XP_005757064.1 cysteine--tRNA ligase [Emiliania huxleyi CCMP1516]